MHVLVWIIEETWEATVDAAAGYLPVDADVTLLHVASTEPEALARGARRGLLGRRTPPPATEPLATISTEAAESLLADAQARFGRAAQTRSGRGRVEREVVAAADDADILICARDGDRQRLGPHSLGPATRFVVDHAPCQVLLVWPDATPELSTIPPPPDGSPPDGPLPPDTPPRA